MTAPTGKQLFDALAVLNALGVRLKTIDAQAVAYLHYQRRKAEIGHVAALAEVIEAHPQVTERQGQFTNMIGDQDYRRVRTRANQIGDRIKIDPGLDNSD